MLCYWDLGCWTYSWLDNRLGYVFGLFVYVELWFRIFVLNFYLFYRALPFSFRHVLFGSIGVVNWGYVSLFFNWLSSRFLRIRITKRVFIGYLCFLGLCLLVEVAFFFCLLDGSFERWLIALRIIFEVTSECGFFFFFRLLTSNIYIYLVFLVFFSSNFS